MRLTTNLEQIKMLKIKVSLLYKLPKKKTYSSLLISF